MRKGCLSMRTLKFNIYDEFACTGTECQETCCQQWRITFTKKEYLSFRDLECSQELRAKMDSAFERIKPGDELHYAKIKLREDGYCPMLDKDGLCMLQREKGESVMNIVCSTFPRNWELVGTDVVVFTLSPACCHVVELFMQHPEGLALVEEEYNGKNKWINKGMWIGGTFAQDSGAFPYIWHIKTAQLDILQNRNFTIPERLLILGYYTRKAYEYLETSPEKLERLGTMMLDNGMCREIADSLRASLTEADAAVRYVGMLYILSKGVRSLKNPNIYLQKLIDTLVDNMEVDCVKNEEGQDMFRWNADTYAKNRELYRKIEEERPYIIENLLVNLAFGRLSESAGELWADYFSLAVLYNFLRTGIAAFLHESCSDAELAQAIAKIVKILINSDLTKNMIMQDFINNGLNSLPHVALLIN